MLPSAKVHFLYFCTIIMHLRTLNLQSHYIFRLFFGMWIKSFFFFILHPPFQVKTLKKKLAWNWVHFDTHGAQIFSGTAHRNQSSFVKLVFVSIYCCHNWLLLANMVWGGGRGDLHTGFKVFCWSQESITLLLLAAVSGTQLLYFSGTLFIGWGCV